MFQLYTFCKKCWKCISKRKLPKYSIFNGMSQLCCQNYPLTLENFSITKKVVIAKAHLIITILKLKPNNRFNPRFYRGIQDHVIILFQNLGPLLISFPSDLATFEDIIRIVWLGLTFSQCKDLQKFVFIRKHQIIKVLEWLKVHNSFYNDIFINYSLLNTWEDEFIP